MSEILTDRERSEVQAVLIERLTAERDAARARVAMLAEALREVPCSCRYLGDGDMWQCQRCAALAATDAREWLHRQRREARADATKEARKLILRGLTAIARKEWEEGQTLEAWTHEAEEWLATMRLAERIDRAAELEGGRG